MNGFQTFLRKEPGMILLKKFNPFFCLSDFEYMMNHSVMHVKEEEIRCMEFLWNIYQNEDVDVNTALTRWKSSDLMSSKLLPLPYVIDREQEDKEKPE